MTPITKLVSISKTNFYTEKRVHSHFNKNISIKTLNPNLDSKNKKQIFQHQKYIIIQTTMARTQDIATHSQTTSTKKEKKMHLIESNAYLITKSKENNWVCLQMSDGR